MYSELYDAQVLEDFGVKEVVINLDNKTVQVKREYVTPEFERVTVWKTFNEGDNLFPFLSLNQKGGVNQVLRATD